MNDQVSQRIEIRRMALGFTSLRKFVEEYREKGGSRSEMWWRRLSLKSSHEHLIEAASALGVDVTTLIGGSEGLDAKLMREGIKEGRINLNE